MILDTVENDLPADGTTTARLSLDSPAMGTIGSAGHVRDKDYYGVELTAGVLYQFDARAAATGDGTQRNSSVGVVEPQLYGGTTYHERVDHNGGQTNARIWFSPTETALHYVENSGTPGTYTVEVTEVAGDVGATAALAQDLEFGTIVTEGMKPFDDDWFGFDGIAGDLYSVTTDRVSPNLWFRYKVLDPTGTEIESGVYNNYNGHEPSLSFTAASSGRYHVSVTPYWGGTLNDGTYTLVVNTLDSRLQGTDEQDLLRFPATNTGLVVVDGGAGLDTLTFQDRTDTGIDVDFTRETGQVVLLASNEPHDLMRIEGITGTNQADRIAGLDGADTLRGMGGDGLIYTSLGADVLDGGLGNDTLILRGATGANVSLLAGTGWSGTAAGDQLSGFENISGSEGSDVLTGDHGDNRLFGSYGSDTPIGNGGDDTLVLGVNNPFNPNGYYTYGADTAVFNYNYDQYEITGAGGLLTVAYIGPGAGDGTDTLQQIGFLQFADRLLDLGDQQGTDGDDLFIGFFKQDNLNPTNFPPQTFSGGEGDDRMQTATYSAGWVETFLGGAGSDTLDLSAGTAATRVDLIANYARTGATEMTIASVENVVGTDRRDVITANGAYITVSLASVGTT